MSEMSNTLSKTDSEKLRYISDCVPHDTWKLDLRRISDDLERKAVSDEEIAIVNDLAEWSIKYPRGTIYPMHKMSMDNELIALEERAKKVYNEHQEIKSREIK